MARPLITATLCIPYQDRCVLLGRKKRGIGKMHWNGFGGRVEAGERVEEACCREMFEECTLRARCEDLVEVGRILFTYPHSKWFAPDDIPYDYMWPDDKVWLPRVLRGEKVLGEVVFSEEGEMVRVDIVPVSALDFQSSARSADSRAR